MPSSAGKGRVSGQVDREEWRGAQRWPNGPLTEGRLWMGYWEGGGSGWASGHLEFPKAEGRPSPLPRESTTKVFFPQFWPFFSSALTPLSTAFLTERAGLPLPE